MMKSHVLEGDVGRSDAAAAAPPSARTFAVPGHCDRACPLHTDESSPLPVM
jgi:hypothetical protein